MTPEELVQGLVLDKGIEVSNVTFNGVVATTAQVGSGAFANGGATNLGLSAGLLLTSGDAAAVAAPASNFATDINGSGSDPDLALLASGNINDASVLEFDFIPDGDSLIIDYVFGSEEYPEFVCSFNDAFGFFLSGPGINGMFSNNAMNLALIPGTTLPVSINTVNNGLYNNPDNPNCPAMNPQYYINNENGSTIAFDGFTTVLQARAEVIQGETYHIKLAIGDALDKAYDSGVFIGGFVITNGSGTSGVKAAEPRTIGIAQYGSAVRVTVPSGYEGGSLIVCDVMGRRVKQVPLLGHSIEIDLSGYPVGTYIVRLQGASLLMPARFVKL